MFTGIVEEIGSVRSLSHPDGSRADAVLTVAAQTVARDARPGDSIAVSGVCLTVTALHEDGAFTVDVMPETLRRTSLGGLDVGAPVNLEAALPVHGRLGGHVVQGHVDGTATLVERTPGPRWDELTFTLPAPLGRYVVPKGSIAVDGVSLTVAGVGAGTFTVCLIPTTLARTTLGGLRPGQAVNVEADVLAKYVERLVATPAAADPAGAR